MNSTDHKILARSFLQITNDAVRAEDWKLVRKAARELLKQATLVSHCEQSESNQFESEQAAEHASEEVPF